MTDGRIKHRHRASSDRLATIAGSLLNIDAEQLRNRANGGSTVGVLVDEIQALAASVLSQVEQDESDVR